MNTLEKPNYYLIKRNSVFTDYRNIKKINSKHKGYSETIITDRNQEPSSRKLKCGDIIYISESGMGIFAKATVIDNNATYTISDTLDKIIGNKDNNINIERSYWAHLLVNFYEAKKKNDKVQLKYHKYYVDQKVMSIVIPFYSNGLERIARMRQGFILLHPEEVSSIEKPIIKKDNEFKTEIPSKLKFEIHSLINKKLNTSHWIDIDHLVPKSVGGPGNIIENLTPIGLGLNRFKSDSIPIEFLILSKKLLNWKFDTEIEKTIQNYSKNLDDLVNLNLSDNLSFHCKQINEKVQKMNFEKAKGFYLEILKLRYPKLAEIYQEYGLIAKKESENI